MLRTEVLKKASCRDPISEIEDDPACDSGQHAVLGSSEDLAIAHHEEVAHDPLQQQPFGAYEHRLIVGWGSPFCGSAVHNPTRLLDLRATATQLADQLAAHTLRINLGSRELELAGKGDHSAVGAQRDGSVGEKVDADLGVLACEPRRDGVERAAHGWGTQCGGHPEMPNGPLRTVKVGFEPHKSVVVEGP